MQLLPSVREVRVISGGQTGADLAGLWAARLSDFPTGGYAPRDFTTLLGPKPELGTLFNLRAHAKPSYPPRTEANVVAADLTLVCAANFLSPGTKLTINLCKRHQKPYFPFHFEPSRLTVQTDVLDNVVAHLTRLALLGQESIVINVAGNATQNCKRIFEFTFMQVSSLLYKLRHGTYPFDSQDEVDAAVGSLAHLKDSYGASTNGLG